MRADSLLDSSSEAPLAAFRYAIIVALCALPMLCLGQTDDYGDFTSFPSASSTQTASVYLGASADAELSTISSSIALGDDLDGTDDEDGVYVPSQLRRGETGAFVATATNSTASDVYLNAWIDYDGDGTLTVAEQILTDLTIPPGASRDAFSTNFTLPVDAALGTLGVRARLTTTASPGPDGLDGSGEVEDHTLFVHELEDCGPSSILYLCAAQKPQDADAWDHGMIRYLEEQGHVVTPAFTKTGGAGAGLQLYDPDNVSTPVSHNLDDFDAIVVSSTTNTVQSVDLQLALRDTTAGVLLFIPDPLTVMEMADSSSEFQWAEENAFDGNATIAILDYDNPTATWDYVLGFADYRATTTPLLWQTSADHASGIDAIYFEAEAGALVGASATHGPRVFYGITHDGIHENPSNSGTIPVPEAEWFDPRRHLKAAGFDYLTRALNHVAISNCVQPEACVDGYASYQGVWPTSGSPLNASGYHGFDDISWTNGAGPDVPYDVILDWGGGIFYRNTWAATEAEEPAYAARFGNTDPIPFLYLGPSTGTTAKLTHDFSEPVTDLNLILYDIDENDVVTITARDARGNPITDFSTWSSLTGDMTTWNDPPSAALPSWDPTTGIVSASTANNENRSYLILKPDQPVLEITVHFDPEDVAGRHMYVGLFGNCSYSDPKSLLWAIDGGTVGQKHLHLWSFGDYDSPHTSATDYGRLNYIHPITGAIHDIGEAQDIEAMALNNATGDAYFMSTSDTVDDPGSSQALFVYNLNDAAADKGMIRARLLGHIYKPNGHAAEGLAYDPATNRLYLPDEVGSGGNSDTFIDELYYVDLDALDPDPRERTYPTLVGPIQGMGHSNMYVDGIELTHDGRMFTVDGTDDHLYEIDKNTGAIIDLTDLNIPGGLSNPTPDVESIVWDAKHARMLGFDNSDELIVEITLGSDGANLDRSSYEPGIVGLPFGADFEASAMFFASNTIDSGTLPTVVKHVDTGNGYMTTDSANVGEAFTYRIQYDFPNTGSTYTNVSIVDQLPAEVEYLSLAISPHIASGAYDSATHTVTFTFDAVLPGSGFSGEVLINARFPTGTLTDTEANNSAGLDWDDNGVSKSAVSWPLVQVQATNGSVPPVLSNGVQLDMWESADPVYIGSGMYYTIRHGTLGGEAVTNYRVRHYIPEEFIFEFWLHRQPFSAPKSFTVQYRTNQSPSTWRDWPGGSFNSDDDTKHEVSELSLNANEYLTEIRFDYGAMPAGVDYHYDADAQLWIFGEVTTQNFNGMPNDIDGVAVLVGDILNSDAVVTTDNYPDATDSAAATINADLATVDYELYYLDEGPYSPGETVRVGIYTQSPPENIFPLVNPVMTILLPDELEYIGNITTASNIGQSISIPNFTQTPNWDGTGRPLLRFWWDSGNPLTLTPSTEWVEAFVYFDVRIRAAVADGTYNHEIRGWLESPVAHDCQGSRTLVDVNDHDGDSDRTELLCGGNHPFEVFANSTSPGGNAGNYFVHENDNAIYSIDLVTGISSVVGTTTNSWNMNALAFDPNEGAQGTLWYTDQSGYGLYKFDVDTGAEIGLIGNLADAGWTDPIGSSVLSGAWYNGAYYVGTNWNDDLYQVTFNGAKTAIVDVVKVADLKGDATINLWGDFIITDSGVIYGVENGSFFSYDLNTSGPLAPIAGGVPFTAITISGNGNLYGIDENTANMPLYTVNPTTGGTAPHVSTSLAASPGDFAGSMTNLTGTVIDSCSANNIIQNRGFEDTTGSPATFSSSFQGSPAEPVGQFDFTILPSWVADWAGPATPEPYWIDDSADAVNNPEGSKFVWLPASGPSYCMRQDVNVVAGTCYEICAWVAPFTDGAPQQGANFRVEVFGGGIDDGSGGGLVLHDEALPASASWNDLNWKRVCFEWVAPITTSTSFYFTQGSGAGLAIDGICFTPDGCDPNPGDAFFIHQNTDTLYTINLETGVPSVLGTTTATGRMNGLAYDEPNNLLWYVDNGTYELYQFDLSTNTEVGIVGDLGDVAWTSPITVGLSDGAAWYNGSLYVGTDATDDLYQVTFNSGYTAIMDVVKVADINGDASAVAWGDFAISSNGVLYGADAISGDVFSYDILSAGPRQNVATGTPVNGVQIGGDGKLYGIQSVAANSPLYVVDLGTGNTSLHVNTGLASTPGDLAGPVLPEPIGSPVEISVLDVTGNEGDSSVSVTVALSSFSDGTVAVDYATSDDTATAGSDYTNTSGTLSFPVGTSTGIVVIPLLDDGDVEPAERFLFTVSNPVGGTIVDAQGEVTLVDNDGTVGVGNLVFIDGDANGVYDSGEGVDGVAVDLYASGATVGVTAPVNSTVTAGGGQYGFANLATGNYFVHIPGANFYSSGALFGTISLPGTAAGDDDMGEDGIDAAVPASSGVKSTIFTLADNSSPINSTTETGFANTDDDADDDNTNLTIDFGFVDAALTTIDTDNDTVADADDLDDDNDGIPDSIELAGCDPITSSWTGSGLGPYTSTAGSSTVTITGTAVGNADFSFYTTPTGAFGSENFWSEPLVGASSFQAWLRWDTTPENQESDIDGAGDDQGTGQMTIDFGTPVVNPILHIDRLGGSGHDPPNRITNSARLEVITPGITLVELTGTDDFDVTATTIVRPHDVVVPESHIGEAKQTISEGTAAGSVQLIGVFQTVTFEFSGVGVEGFGNDVVEFIITNICPVESYDYDGDGIGNHLDLDSDNDGIPDVIEAGGNDADGDGIIGVGPITDSDNDGLHDPVDDTNGAVTSGTPLPLPNTDTTGGPNYLDIDADADGIPDNIESQSTASYFPPSFIDADGDGLDDAYDNLDGYEPGVSAGSAAFLAGTSISPVNTDSADSPDYLDSDTDNDGTLDIAENGDSDNALAGTDTDGDGLDDNFDTDNSTWDPNDRIDDPNPTTLGDADGDVSADGNSATPLLADVDFRDNPSATGGVSLGNLVWNDVNSDGLYQSATESGISGATVELWASGADNDFGGTGGDADSLISSTLTGASGDYSFINVAPGSYYLRVTPPASFPAPSPYSSSQVADNGVDNNNNGYYNNTISAITSRVIQLTSGGEPGSSGSTDSENTIDFGFAACSALTLNPATLSDRTVGFNTTIFLSASPANGTTTFSVTSGSLPPGISITASPNRLTGVPTTAGTYNFTLQATDALGCTGSQNYTWRICPRLLLNPSELPDGKVGVPFSMPITASGGTAPYTISISPSSLPDGLTWDGTTLSGTPLQEQQTVFGFNITDADGCTGYYSYQFRVCPPQGDTVNPRWMVPDPWEPGVGGGLPVHTFGHATISDAKMTWDATILTPGDADTSSPWHAFDATIAANGYGFSAADSPTGAAVSDIGYLTINMPDDDGTYQLRIEFDKPMADLSPVVYCPRDLSWSIKINDKPFNLAEWDTSGLKGYTGQPIFFSTGGDSSYPTYIGTELVHSMEITFIPENGLVGVWSSSYLDFALLGRRAAWPDANHTGVGNLVFIDANGNGQYDTDEGINHITVELYRQGDVVGTNPPLTHRVTQGGGHYYITGVPAGNYFLHIPASEFSNLEELYGDLSVLGAGGDDGIDDDSDENGVDDASPEVNGISSGVFTLSIDGEPTASETGFLTSDDAGDDNNSDLTQDFGFTLSPSLTANILPNADIECPTVTAGEYLAPGFIDRYSGAGYMGAVSSLNLDDTDDTLKGGGAAACFLGVATGGYTYTDTDGTVTYGPGYLINSPHLAHSGNQFYWLHDQTRDPFGAGADAGKIIIDLATPSASMIVGQSYELSLYASAYDPSGYSPRVWDAQLQLQYLDGSDTLQPAVAGPTSLRTTFIAQYMCGEGYIDWQKVTFSFTYTAAMSKLVISTNPAATGAHHDAGVFIDNLSLRASVLTGSDSITGVVYEDIHYGGGAGRSLSASSGVGINGVRVELYRDNAGTYQFVASTTTSTLASQAGSYAFPSLPSGDYRVRVVNNATDRVPSTRSGDSNSVFGIQTYRTDATSGSAVAVSNEIGGHTPSAAADAASETVVGASFPVGSIYWAPANLSGALTDVDFGFNFDTIVNTNSSGLGSLDQFADNATALANTGLAQAGSRLSLTGTPEALPAGVETSIFMIPAGDLDADGIAQITLSSTLIVRDDFTSIDGTTQTVNIGDTNPGMLGTGGTVGVDGLALPQVPAPEVELRGRNTWTDSADIQFRGLAYLPTGTALNLEGTVGRYVVELNVLGSGGASFSAPTTPSGNDLVDVFDAKDCFLRNNLIGFNESVAVYLDENADNWTITGNEFRGIGVSSWDSAIHIETGVNGTLVEGNLFANNQLAIDTNSSTGIDSLIRNNTIIDTVGTAISIYGSAGDNHDVVRNIIRNSGGVGVFVRSGTGHTIIENAIYDNSGLGIDLASGGAPDGVTPNDPGDTDNGANIANGLLNFPEIGSLVPAGGDITINYNLDTLAGSYRIDFYANTTADSTGHGEGEIHLGSHTIAHAGAGSQSFAITLTPPSAFLIEMPVAATTTVIDGSATGSGFGATSEFSASYTLPIPDWMNFCGYDYPIANDMSLGAWGGSEVNAASGNGLYAVGVLWSDLAAAPYLMDLTGPQPVLIELKDAAGDVISGQAWGVSDDGSVVIAGNRRWTAATGLVPLVGLGDLTGTSGISGDGNTIVGFSRAAPSPSPALPVYWVGAGAAQILPLLGGHTTGSASAVNSDGSVIAGISDGLPVIWVRSGAVYTVQALPLISGETAGRARGVSADGRWVVGTNGPSLSDQAFLYDRSTSTLTDISGIYSRTLALDVSNTGMVVGSVRDGSGWHYASVWDSTNGWRRIEDLMVAAGIPLGAFTNWYEADAISDDGRIIHFFGNNGEGWPDSGVMSVDPLPCVPAGVIGNRVWLDDGGTAGIASDAIRQSSEFDIEGVTVELYQDNGSGVFDGADVLLDTQVTDKQGQYHFISLPDGDYFVHFPASNFASGAPLDGLTSTPGLGAIDTDNQDNGVDGNAPVDGITSRLIEIAIGLEPDASDDDDSTAGNITVDFGFVTTSGFVSVSIDDATVNEGAGTASVNLTLSSPVSWPVQVDYATADGSAVAGSDYTTTSGTVTFLAFSASESITIPVTDDGSFERNEDFVVNLSNPSASSIADSQATVTIVDNECDETPFLIQNTTADLYGVDFQNAQTNLLAANIAAYGINGIGYNITDHFIWGFKRVAPWDTVVRINADYSVTEFTIPGLNADSYHIGDVDANGILHLGRAFETSVKRIDVNPNSPNYLQLLPDLTLSKGDSWGDWAFHAIDGNLYTVDRAEELFRINPSTGLVTKLGNLRGIRGTGYFGACYCDGAGAFYALREENGIIYRMENVHLLTGATDPTVEFFSRAPSGWTSDGARCALAAPPSGPLRVNVSDAVVTEGAATANVTISLTTTSGSPVSVDYTTLNNTAAAGTDYTTATGTVTIPAGSTSTSVSVSIIQDTIPEGQESFFVVISNPTGGAILADDAGIVSITDDDATDTDRDGSPDIDDIDDDNDGILDVDEAFTNVSCPSNVEVILLMDNSGSISSSEWDSFSAFTRDVIDELGTTGTVKMAVAHYWSDWDATNAYLYLESDFTTDPNVAKAFVRRGIGQDEFHRTIPLLRNALNGTGTGVSGATSTLSHTAGAEIHLLFMTDAAKTIFGNSDLIDPSTPGDPYKFMNDFKTDFNVTVTGIRFNTGFAASDAEANAAVAALSSVGGIYTGIVDVNLTDPEGSQTIPRRFYNVENFGGIPGTLASEIANLTCETTQDADGDGFPDHLDIDSDNDGIPDNVEAQSTAGYVPPNGDAGPANMGLDTAYTGGLTPVDSDGDSTTDVYDTDSDNDGDADIIENGDTDNIASGSDTDSDGLDNNFDSENVLWDPNDHINDPNPTTLGDFDGDVAANGDNAAPMIRDVDFRDPGKQGDYGNWQSLNAFILGSNSNPTDNPDGDLYDNLLEYAICLHPGTGLPGPGGFFVESDATGVHAKFYRPQGGLTDVTYEIHGLGALPVFDFETWTIMASIPGTGAPPPGVTVTPVGNAIEEVKFSNLQLLAPVTPEHGFIRLAVKFGTLTSYTPVWGWTESVIEQGQTETYANPFTPPELLSGVIDSVTGNHTIDVASSTGGVALESELTPVITAYYIEIIEGENAGHRFDIASVSGSTITLATDSDLYAGPPFNTQLTPVSIPTDLAGDRFILRPHHTINDLFPPATAGFTPQPDNADPANPADRLYLYSGDWTPYWFYTNASGSGPIWDEEGDALFVDSGGEVIAPNQGLFVVPQQTTITILSLGIVRKNPFAMPLPQGWSLQSAVYPLDQSPAERFMNQDTFDGHDEPAMADTVCTWLGDADVYETEFRCTFLWEPATSQTPRWLFADDENMTPRDFDTSLFPKDRSSFYYRHLAPKPDYVLPLPWCVGLIGE